MYLPSILLAPIEALVNASLRLDPDTLAQVAAISGQCIAVELRGLDLKVFIEPTASGILLATSSDSPPVATLSGTPLNLLRMAIAPSDSSPLLTGEVQIHGDIELGRKLRTLLQRLDLDLEELLSHYTGNLLAHQIGNGMRGFKAWSRKAASTLGQNLAEYLREEIQLLPDHAKVATFLDEIDRLRADSGRLEARIQRLQRLL
ncbi:ubiquinone biosynthesis accessory factor UbiJ [Nitrosococcus watsonii]|uniref:Ubiquinone biosynthesis accessory factor UbiJ n=1 Tax=Nitrosococcus watsoni (strain C-113) TaxID=105559 RepID=D8K7Z5_NITWC|nr:SCP2 sterol-binding domain-containing protein [Nitrosococcus watsonii]ADJ29022.1 Sterol-binding domain protein [Nitrosococcus watsonii C-113]